MISISIFFVPNMSPSSPSARCRPQGPSLPQSPPHARCCFCKRSYYSEEVRKSTSNTRTQGIRQKTQKKPPRCGEVIFDFYIFLWWWFFDANIYTHIPTSHYDSKCRPFCWFLSPLNRNFKIQFHGWKFPWLDFPEWRAVQDLIEHMNNKHQHCGIWVLAAFESDKYRSVVVFWTSAWDILTHIFLVWRDQSFSLPKGEFSQGERQGRKSEFYRDYGHLSMHYEVKGKEFSWCWWEDIVVKQWNSTFCVQKQAIYEIGLAIWPVIWYDLIRNTVYICIYTCTDVYR